MNKERIRELAYKYALLNAFLHNGKAVAKAVLGKIIAEDPELKRRIPEVIQVIEEVVKEVNKLSLKEQEKILSERYPKLLGKKPSVEEKKLPPLPNVDKYKQVVTRFAPNPDFVLHIGNARPAILSYEYARMYKGKFILRFEDTDPKTKSPKLEYYDLIKDDLRWLGLKWDEEYIQSKRMEIYYDYGRKLLELGKAYICTHSSSEIREMRKKGVRCECASLSIEDRLEMWDKMLEGAYGEGEAVYRVITDSKHPDPSVRDWIAFRIIDTDSYPHPIVGSKYVVWPTYNFACGVDDHLMGVTHILRAKEHMANTVKQKFIYKHFGWRYPEAIHFGRLKLEGFVLSKSKIRAGLERGEYTGVDDPRLGTLQALKRRGFTPESIWSLILDVGIKPSSAVISFENLSALNRKIIEPKANRYMFVYDYKEARIVGVAKPLTAHVPYHPSFPERGYREYKLTPENGAISLYISGSDFNSLKEGGNVRLLGLANFRILKKSNESLTLEIVGLSLDEAKEGKYPIIQWISPAFSVDVEVLRPYPSKLEKIRGLGERELARVEPGLVVQFIRFGFVKIEEVNANKVLAVYTHD